MNERDRVLTKAMELCYHEWNPEPVELGGEWYYQCDLCNITRGTTKHTPDWRFYFDDAPDDGCDVDFDSWKGFGLLWEWANDDYISTAFGQTTTLECVMRCSEFGHDLTLVNPTKFADALYKELKE